MRYDDDTAHDDARRVDMAETYIAAKKWGTVWMIAGSIRDTALKNQLKTRVAELEAADHAENAANSD